MRPKIKSTLYLPQEASDEFFYNSTKRWCCGLTLLAEDSDIAAIDSSFKLLTSPDMRVAADAASHAEEVIKNKISNDPSVREVSLYLSCEDEGVFREAMGYIFKI